MYKNLGKVVRIRVLLLTSSVICCKNWEDNGTLRIRELLSAVHRRAVNSLHGQKRAEYVYWYNLYSHLEPGRFL